MRALAVTAASLRRMVRDRTALFFVVLLPVLMIVIIGAIVQSPGGFRLGVPARPGSEASALVDELSGAGPVHTFVDEQEARTALRRGELDAVVLVPADLDSLVTQGRSVELQVLAGGAPSTRSAVIAAIGAAVSRHAERIQAAAFAARYAGGSLTSQLPRATEVRRATPRIGTRVENVATESDYLPTGFGYSAPTMLLLFVFINTLASGAAIAQTRGLGIYTRALAAPIRSRDLVAGEALCYLLLALVQSALIVAVGGLLFGVSWGNPLAAAALVVVWAALGAGAGMLSGSVFRTPEQASSIGPVIGIGFGMLGGCMWPLEIVPPVVRTIGHITPHAWAVDAWIVVLSKGGSIADIAGPLAVLTLFAAGLLVAASYRLHRRLTA
ncbi:ABC transporter permease [Kribbella koreensis]|uniref:ABC transporter permease n=1 Tax=Kribbella koreensis TaxID=57909 RepID=UPI0031CEB531